VREVARASLIALVVAVACGSPPSRAVPDRGGHAGGDAVRIELAGGKLAHWELQRAQAVSTTEAD